ncbi:serine threonine protein [Lichtheimia corymbifera JMRC:FSU:9682]|uniref:non-specific serine/threonine protein kinase n=1 Tax=Lichtheimia corymbifera JMRC:FSU:9682 TaxID=1263082 RepID=A0A068RM86_9FUNG|nr:serine threonine protein [Lichtheimia corymbifera JMRC:FSU:9682]
MQSVIKENPPSNIRESSDDKNNSLLELPMTQDSRDAVNDDLVLGADSLIRLREHHEDDWHHRSRESNSSSTRHPQESLHSYRFASSNSSTTRTDIADLRRSLMNRSRNFIRQSRSSSWKTTDTLPAHYDPTTLTNTMMMEDIGRTKTKSVGHSPVAYFSMEHYRSSRRRQHTNPMADIIEGKSSRPASPVTPDDGDLVAEKFKSLKVNETTTTTTTCSPPPPLNIITPDDNNNNNTTSRTSTVSYSSSCCSSSSLSDDPRNDGGTLSPRNQQRHPSSCAAIFPHPVLHNTSRFLPQNQAILTTYDDWRVILSNDIAALVLVGASGSCRSLVGRSVIEFIEPSYRSRFLDMVSKRKQELSHLEDSSGGMVLVCGNVLPIVKQDGTKSAASLWLKEKRNDAGSPVYIWIFEEVFETVTHLSIDMEGTIRYVDDTVHELYGYEPGELIGQSVDMIIPSLAQSPYANRVEHINHLRFFGSRTKLGAHFPIVAKVHTVSRSDTSDHQQQQVPCFTLRITSIPMIAGLVTIHRDGTIEGCNAEFAKYMFGLSQDAFVTGKKQGIADVLPQIPTLLQCLQRDDLLQHGIIINSLICRKLVADMETTPRFLSPMQGASSRKLTETPNGQSLPILFAVHRDKTPFEVQLQLKLMEGTDDICALWITFDRDATFARFGHVIRATNPPLEIKQQDGLGLPTAKRPLVDKTTASSSSDDQHYPPSTASSAVSTSINDKSDHSCSKHDDEPTPSNTRSQEENDRPAPRIITSFSRPTFASTVNNNDNSNNNVPSSPISPCTIGTPVNGTRQRSGSLFQTYASSSSSSGPEYSAQTNATTIDDYIIVENLGQGAYGLVKLAVRKDDPEQRKVVIKYVIKSRILVDCWTKDRKLGVIPVEIHILHTLRKIPHANCSDMLDYFEDDDHYYIVMGLHGVGMDLFDYIELKNGMDDMEIRSIFKQIALAVRHLHDHKIVHRDIKDENVVLDQNGGVRLIDFGSAAYLKGRRYDTFVGTLDYAAPEILAGQTYEGPAQDIWALGILLYTLVYRENPFYDIDEILSHELRIPFVLSEGSLDLIQKMLDRNVENRLNIHQVLEHPWLN